MSGTTELRTTIAETIYKASLALDAKAFADFFALCDETFNYKITAHSPEIRKDMIFLEHDRSGLQTLITNLPKHNSDHSPICRHINVYTVDIAPDGKSAQVVSGLQVYKTTIDGGFTELFAVGKIYDTVKLTSGKAMLADRRIHLDTRMLGIGYHIPF